ncbi:MAG: BatD family protein, partial [Deltaproteobacteria bacterium]|nr:BatD family protein [Deltaproteobacteria bacterium]
MAAGLDNTKANPGLGLAVWPRRRLGALAVWVLALMAVPTTAWAEVRMQLRVSATRVTLEDQLQVVLSAAGEFDAISELHSDGFDFQQGGHQTQVSIINGAMTRIESFTFVGSPSKPGTFKLGPIEARLGGQVVGKSSAVDVTVAGDEQTAAPGQRPETASDLRTYQGQPVFVRPVLSVTEPYAGQQVIVAWELYWAQNMQLQGIRETSGPKLDGLDPEDLLKDHPKAEPVRIGGRPYMRQILHRILISAPRAGTYPLVGPTLRVEVGDFFESKAAKLVSPTLEMQVRALPDAGRPADFDPASIGKLAMTATLQVAGKTATSHKVKVGERLLLQVNVSGEGNLLALKPVEPPKLQGMTVEALPGGTRDGVRTGERGSEGTRTWQYILSFSAPGRYELPAMAWTSFDASTGKYARSEAGPFEVVVEGEALPAAAAPAGDPKVPAPGAGHSGAAVPRGGATAPAQRGVPRPIAPAMGLNADTSLPWHARPWVLAGAALPWLAAAGRGLWLMLQRRRQRLAPSLARAGAPGRAKERLKAAAQLEPGAGYGEAHRIIEQLIEELSGASEAGLADQALRERLAALGLGEAAVRNLADLMQHCDYARYAPGGNRPADLSSTCDTLAGLVDELASALQAGKSGKHRTVGHAVLLLLATALLLPFGRPAQAASLEATFAQGN